MTQLPSKQKGALSAVRRSQALAPVPASVQNARPSGEEKQQAMAPKTPEKKKEQPKERKKNLPDTPPPIITDSRRGMDYRREKSLGEGGFARCFEVYNPDNEVFAAKVVSKKSLSSQRMKSKFLGELQVHKTMEHPNIVRFKECFEDSQNVYMILELCNNKSLMDLLRRRKFFTEPEARFFLIQMLGAVKYMHSRNVIHRDLKLGNIFLDENLNVKIGDFGLAALLIDGTERKNTICGTPNYIAPEVLFGKEEGHSFEVDLWSLGIILYAMLIGKPPFQSSDVKEIYQKIKVATFSYPNNPPQQISHEAKDLIKSLLSPDPRNRPTIDDIADHSFFKTGYFPRQLPIATLRVVPAWDDQASSSKGAWYRNFLEVARVSGVGLGIEGVGASRGKGVEILPINEDDDEPMSNVVVQAPIGQKMIVAPVVLLSPASQRTKPNQRMIPEELSPKITKTRNIGGMPKIPSRLNPLREMQQQRASKDSLALAPLEGFRDLKISSDKNENAPASANANGYKLPSKIGQRGVILDSKIRAPKLPTVYAAGSSRSNPIDVESTASQPAQRKPSSESTTPNYRSNLIPNASREVVIENIKQTLKSLSAFNKRTVDTLPPQPKETRIAIDQTNRARITPMNVENGAWITKWVDYSNKYGVGYILNDNTTATIFKDGTNILLDFPKPDFDMESALMEYVVPKKATRTTMLLKDAARFRSSGLADKAGICKKLGDFMLNKLGNATPDGETETFGARSVDHSQKSYISHFVRVNGGVGPDGKEIIYAVFRLDEGGFQINFPDHFKIILHHDGRTIRFFDQSRIVYTVSLEELYTLAHTKRQTGVAVLLSRNDIHKKMQIFQSILEGWLSCDSKTGEFLRKGQKLAVGEIVIALGGYSDPS
ncbi:Cell cycle serine/threonine-protein kinase cdc5/MSD2 [Orbilia oligospora]|uniref:Serine/threonine-protein kinase n=1 Tax=Orbilia oligospora TaxID=2813651 RepID=A0A7C8JEX5_ORBOL|nr:Cell cycle serine/threonine-protein kinase cdc5/MSD2 [Orbilia oligospora]KAF3093099.1 Cell cycle serine/threonine-protein kinase cdc5/MSD2 [Orbilia oligospora]KAF3102228.1 Cell cycle serine/threonine-protein kinase cdc5/MSD2 [Orbilia oligospora]KAF3125251.1 Cell cycle serine/threonine-protein kinase cdc5/MSD2 [Orbilia oligospora]KAF3135880.1 Cell cycle serine/threonine-protein kinase cdc5/MSD2 [Orbilia oligospora]